EKIKINDTIAIEAPNIKLLIFTSHWKYGVIHSNPNCIGKSTKKALSKIAIDPVIITGIVPTNAFISAIKNFLLSIFIAIGCSVSENLSIHLFIIIPSFNLFNNRLIY